MKRSVKVSLNFVTGKKRRRLDHLLRRLRKLTNRYIQHVWNTPDACLNAATLKAVPCHHLGYRQRTDCLKYAMDIVHATREAALATGIVPSMPRLKGGFKFSSLTATVEKGNGSFDYILKIASLVPGRRLILPFRSHRRLNYWLSQPGAKILNGCIIQGDMAVLWIDLPDLCDKQTGDEIGVDLGYNKLLACSDGQTYGHDIKAICEKVRRKKPGSRARQRAHAERDQYINRIIKRLPWDRLRLIACEDLTNLKRGKKPNRSKSFRKRLAPWSYRRALARIEFLAEESRTRFVSVDPRHTSQECFVCGSVSRENRVGEKFRCRSCGHTDDADVNGARNILARTTGNSQQHMVAGPP